MELETIQAMIATSAWSRQVRNVLRFRKIKSTDEIPVDGGRARIEFEYKFFQEITSKYLGKFVEEPEFVYCNPVRDIPDWSERVEAHRPEHRRDKRLFEEYGIILPDYSLLPSSLEEKTKNTEKPTFCIEIKPKQGFVPEANRLFQRCPYCINQFYKVSTGIISKRSNYCPCDLFSGNRNRVKQAIKSLVESPQNNFIVFKNGIHAWSEKNKLMDLKNLLAEWFLNDSYGSSCDTEQQLIEDMSYLISEAILREFPVSENDPILSNPIKKSKKTVEQVQLEYYQLDLETICKVNTNLKRFNQTCEFPSGKLPQGSALNRIFFMQQLHCINTDVVYAMYSSYSSILNEQMVYFPQPNQIKLPNECNRHKTQLNYDQIIILQKYLLFSIARDCSILISFREIDLDRIGDVSRNHVIVLSQRHRYFSFNIGITDVDPKNLNCIEKHRQHTIRALNSVITVD
ncbi:inositol-pentakisphosphate 2-kinase isoform X2 [Chelonus insularis]|uniref:inositol-pentakisphosphate 2-kinase isoform X2 n=1 Tax=Chelonus insularis TaxID=460826 RepID=UPI00158E8EDD|nr:inositol-pentakisphosphate 2-kinase isoform X2 [Chelonus insularis]